MATRGELEGAARHVLVSEMLAEGFIEGYRPGTPSEVLTYRHRGDEFKVEIRLLDVTDSDISTSAYSGKDDRA